MHASGPLTENNHRNYGALWRENEAQLIVYLTKLLGRAELAQDVAHDAYVGLCRADQSQQLPHPRARLFNVATHLALIHLTRRRVGQHAMGSPLDAEEVDPEELACHVLESERAAHCERVGEELVQAIKTLAPRLRKAFVMTFVEGRPRGDIAVQLNISENTLEKRITKAIIRCRERLVARGIDIADLL